MKTLTPCNHTIMSTNHHIITPSYHHSVTSSWHQVILSIDKFIIPQTVWLTLGVCTVIVKGGVLDRRRRAGLRGNYRTFVLFNFFDVHFS